MGMCLNNNKKRVAGLAVVGVGVLLFVPNATGLLVLVVCMAACPLAMVVMMRMMSGGSTSTTSDSSSMADDPLQTGAIDEIAALRAEAQHLRTDHARQHGRPTKPTRVPVEGA